MLLLPLRMRTRQGEEEANSAIGRAWKYRIQSPHPLYTNHLHSPALPQRSGWTAAPWPPPAPTSSSISPPWPSHSQTATPKVQMQGLEEPWPQFPSWGDLAHPAPAQALHGDRGPCTQEIIPQSLNCFKDKQNIKHPTFKVIRLSPLPV